MELTGIDPLRLLRGLPGAFAYLRPDPFFTLVEASEAFLQAIGRAREDVVGRPLLDVFPQPCAGEAGSDTLTLEGALGRVRAMRAPEKLPARRFEVGKAAPDGDGESGRRWGLTVTPIAARDGAPELLVLAIEDATDLTGRARARQDLRASEILDSITEGFFSLDRDWRFTYLNREGSHILDARPEELLGRTLWEAYPGLEGTDFERHYRTSMDERRQASFTAFYPLHQRWYQVQVYPAPEGVSIYFRNVTSEKLVEAERERLTAESDRLRRIYEVALSNTPDLVYIFDLEHRFVYANEALLAMWGLPREQALGRTCLELGYAEWHAQMHDREIDTVVATRAPIRGEVPFVGTGGRRIWDYIFVPALGPEGEVVAVAGTARDTTEQRATHEAIAENAVRLQEVDRAKDEFIATLSHELRNPLAPLRNAVALLLMDREAAPRTVAIHRMMERQVEHLVRLVDDLLELSRVTRGDFMLRRERVQLSAVVRNAVETSEPVLQARKHSVTVALPEEPVWVDADPVRLAQVVSNLLDNAAKYTPEGGRIEVALERRGSEALVRVRDNGAGIDPEARRRIFEMFNRGDRGAMHHEGGLGIGLAISRRLAEMHGATIEVESEGVGKGSEFTVRMPLAEGAAPAVAARPAGDAVGARRVLVVDDNRDAAESLGMILRELGAEVCITHDGAGCIAAFADFEPAAVLLDIGMPEMDGYEVVRRLRERHPGHRAAVIALTGWGQEQDRLRAKEAGFDHHIVKPAELRALRALLASL